jgi:monoamine oxidase
MPLYICGEAYSDAQGWVEGALQTADMMLAKWGLGAL